MGRINNEPIVRALIKKEQSIRTEKRISLVSADSLDSVDRLVVDLALNDLLPVDSVLPDEYVKQLILSTSRYYQVSYNDVIPDYDRILLAHYDPSSNKVDIYIYSKSTDVLSVKQFRVLVQESVNQFLTTDLPKADYLARAVHLSKNKVFQFREDLDETVLLLSHVVYQIDLMGLQVSPFVETKLVDLLEDTEVTIHLNITDTVKLYGEIDSEKFLNLYIREIGTPDTFWKRSVLLTELLSNFS